MRGTSRAGRVVVPAGLLLASLAAGACGREEAPSAMEVLREGTFRTLEGGEVTLSGGTGVSDGNVRHGILTAAEGDLDFDTEPDAAAVLVADQGREQFVILHALLAEGGQLLDASARLIGDRIEVRRLAISEGMIRVDVRVRRPREPITVPPSVDLTRHFVLTNRGLVPILLADVAETAAPETASEGAALHTHEWELESFEAGDWSADLDALDDPVRLKFLAALSDGTDMTGELSGFAGCNRIVGSFRTQQAEALRFYGLATTRKRCPDRPADIEQRLFEALGSVKAYQLSGDRLVLALIGGAIRFRAGGTLISYPAGAADVEGTAEDSRS